MIRLGRLGMVSLQIIVLLVVLVVGIGCTSDLGTPVVSPLTEVPLGTPTATPDSAIQVEIGPSATPSPMLSVEITDIEVTQGIQNLANDMPLVDGRETYVRVYVRALQTKGAPINNVAAVLCRVINGQPEDCFQADNGFVDALPSGGNRLILNDSFYFRLPPPWRTGTQTIQAGVLWNVVNIAVEQRTLTFHETEPLNLMLLPLHFHDDFDPFKDEIVYFYGENPFGFDSNYSDAWDTVNNVRRFHPVSTINVDSVPLPLEPLFHFCFTWPPPPFPPPPVLCASPLALFEWKLLALVGGEVKKTYSSDDSLLLAIRALNNLYTDTMDDQIWLGMVPPEVFNNFHTGSCAGGAGWKFEAFSVMEPVMRTDCHKRKWDFRAGAVTAHELGHSKGLHHVNCTPDDEDETGPDEDYPFTGNFNNVDGELKAVCSLSYVDDRGYYGFDVYWTYLQYDLEFPPEGQYEPIVISNSPEIAEVGYPIMSYKKPRWIDPYHYCKLLGFYGGPNALDGCTDFGQ